jgi:hypothetical protein
VVNKSKAEKSDICAYLARLFSVSDNLTLSTYAWKPMESESCITPPHTGKIEFRWE